MPTNGCLTHSQITCGATCGRKALLAYEHGLRREVQPAAIRIGNVVHKAKELWAGHRDSDKAILAALACYGAIPEGLNDPYAWAIERETVARLLYGYFWYWEEDHKLMTVQANEQVFDVPITNPATGRASRTFRMAGKMDQIILYGDTVCLMETKTTSQDITADSVYCRRLRIDSQISNYFWAAQASGHKVEKILYNLIKKPTIKPRQIPVLDDDGLKMVEDKNGRRVYKRDGQTPRQSADKTEGWFLKTRPETPTEYGDRLTADIGERPGFYYRRFTVPRMASDIDEAKAEVWQNAKLYRWRQQTNCWPRNTAACAMYGQCTYLDICTNGYDFDASAPPKGFRFTDNIHEELVIEGE